LALDDIRVASDARREPSWAPPRRRVYTRLCFCVWRVRVGVYAPCNAVRGRSWPRVVCVVEDGDARGPRARPVDRETRCPAPQLAVAAGGLSQPHRGRAGHRGVRANSGCAGCAHGLEHAPGYPLAWARERTPPARRRRRHQRAVCAHLRAAVEPLRRACALGPYTMQAGWSACTA